MEMENNEMMVHDEVIETTEEVMSNGSNVFKTVAGVGAVVLFGGLAYKYIVKPAIAKVKEEKKKQLDEKTEVVNAEYDEVEE